MTGDDEIAAIESKLDSIRASALRIKNEDGAYGIWADLVLTTSRINALMLTTAPPTGGAQTSSRALQSPPEIVSKLQGWVQKIKAALEALAKFLKAASYTVGVYAPFGISVAITFSAG
ncbi:MAG TPA: hypothetical protein VND40_00835 [Nitrososphaerales archaeon]|nr:hypothetical protein [Nitrososphaerales archaeon]